MDIPLQVSFRNMDSSEAVEARIREKAEKLETYFGHINSCRVMVEAPERRRQKASAGARRASSTMCASRSACPART
jgi:ribosome-associated translation inhibitor RaiA